MNAIIWKKYINIRNNKTRLYLFLVFPILYFILLNFMYIDTNVILAYFAFTCTLCSNFFHWNVEDLIYSEVMLVSQISIKKYWRTNYLLITLSGYIYSFLILIIGSVLCTALTDRDFSFSGSAAVQSITLIVTAMSVIAMSSVHYSDFSRIKQIYTGVFGVMPIIVPIFLCLYPKYFIVDYYFGVWIVVISVLLIILSEIIVGRTKNENLVINIQKLVTGYTANIMND